MNEKERAGTENVGEIIPHCAACGEYLETDFVDAWGATQHETYKFKCEECGHETSLYLEHCWFSSSSHTKEKLNES